jgi:aminopeptidase N
MGLDALRATRPIRSKASTPAEISELFDPIAYEKGAAVLRMLEAWVGPEDFQKSVNTYIEKFKYGNARAEDFWGTLTSVTGKPVDKVMGSFVDQAGLPLVSIEVTCAGGSSRAVLSQERYFRDPASAGTATAAPLWQIPVCLQSSAGDSRCEVLRQKRQEISFAGCPAWVMGNSGARGYYRAAISPAMVRTLAEKVEMLSPAERMAVLSDEWALVRAGRHDVGMFMDLASGFVGERTAAVMQTLGTLLRGVGDEFATGSTAEAYRAWAGKLIAPALRDVGVPGSASDDDERKALRAAVVGIAGGVARDPQLLASSRRLVEQELDKPGTVEPTLLALAINLAALRGDAALYDRYLEASQAATNPEVRYQYLYGLTAFTDPALVRRTMDLAVSDQVRSQDAKLVIGRMLTNQDTHALAWQLVREHWTAIQKKTGEFVGNTMIVGALASFCDASTATSIESFFTEHKVPDAERTLQQSLERINACARGASGQVPKLAEWLKGR